MNPPAPAGQPTLVVISGPPGAGKTTLAHRLARALRCPAICRDELKEGLVWTRGGGQGPEGALDREVYAAFFGAIGGLVRRGISLVAEAAFQHRLWAKGLEPLRDAARFCVIRCMVEPDRLHARLLRRFEADPARERFHQDRLLLAQLQEGKVSLADHRPIHLDGLPTLMVNTEAGYHPPLKSIVAFARAHQAKRVS